MRWLGVVLVSIVILGVIGMVSAAPMAKHTGKPEWAGMGAVERNENVCTHSQTHLRIQNQTCLENQTCIRNQTHLRLHNQTCIKGEETMLKVAHGKFAEHGRKAIEERIREVKIRHRIAKIEMNIQKAKQMVENAKMRYEKAREMYMKLRARGLRDPETFRYAKQYVYFGVDYIERWLERLMVQVQNANMGEDQKERLMVRIENCLMALNESKNAVNSSTTPEELRNAVKDLNNIWNEIRIEIKSIAGQIAVAKLEVIVSKTEDVALKLEGEIEELNGTGVDVTKLNELLNDCLEKLDLARQKLEEANEKFEDMLNATNPNELYVEGRDLLKEARDLIRDAFADIREICYEIQHLRVGHHFFGNETGELLVVGSGTAEINFTGVAVIHADGNVTISPAASVVTVVGFEGGVKDGVEELSGHGKAVIRGENITVKIDGEFMRIFVKGKGTVTLSGEGIYKLKRSPTEKMEEGTFGNVTLEFGVVE